MAVFAQGRAVFISAGAKVVISIGLDPHGHLHMCHVSMTPEFLEGADGFFGK